MLSQPTEINKRRLLDENGNVIITPREVVPEVI